jgi:hypothetical protein
VLISNLKLCATARVKGTVHGRAATNSAIQDKSFDKEQVIVQPIWGNGKLSGSDITSYVGKDELIALLSANGIS